MNHDSRNKGSWSVALRKCRSAIPEEAICRQPRTPLSFTYNDIILCLQITQNGFSSARTSSDVFQPLLSPMYVDESTFYSQ